MGKDQKIRQIITELGESQRSIARILGITQATISNWLSGKAPISSLVIYAFAEKFNINPEWWDDDTAPMFRAEISREAGLDEHETVIIENYRYLNTNRRDQLLQFSHFLKGQQMGENDDG